MRIFSTKRGVLLYTDLAMRSTVVVYYHGYSVYGSRNFMFTCTGMSSLVNSFMKKKKQKKKFSILSASSDVFAISNVNQQFILSKSNRRPHIVCR